MARRVFVDTNVLFPFSLMDLMLSLADDFVHEVLWTDRLLTEWERVIARSGRRSEASAQRITTFIRVGFAESRIPEDQYKETLSELHGPDPDDIHHMAAAIAAGADAIITHNLNDFPAGLLGRHGIAVTPPDPYLCDLLDHHPDAIVDIIRTMAANKRCPPMTPLDILQALHRAGVPTFADRVQELGHYA